MHDAVGVGGGFRIVRDHDDGLSQLLVQLTQHLQHNFRIPGVQVAGGLIRQDDLGLVDDGASDGHALLFPAGKLGRAMAQAVAQTEHLGDHLEAVRIKAVAVDVLGNGDVAESVESGQQVEALEDEAHLVTPQLGALGVGHRRQVVAVHQHAPAAGPGQTANHVEQRGFAAARRPHHGYKLAGQHLEVHPAQGRDFDLARAVELP